MNICLPFFVALPLVAALLVYPAFKAQRRAGEALTLLTTFSLLVLSIVLYFFRPFNFVLIYKIGQTGLILDGLSHLLVLMVSLVAFLVTVYSTVYMEKYSSKEKYYILYLLMLAGMMGVVLSGDLFNLFIFMELAAVSTYALVAFGTKAEELEASFRYLVIGSIASILIIFAMGLVFAVTRTLNMAEIARSFPPDALILKTFISALFIVGFGMKAALVPFHSWLPDAHTVAPAPVSATLSGVLIKVLGVYTLVGILYNVLGMTFPISYALTALGVVSILAAGLLALYQNDLKRLLAYSSISQIGYVILGISLATPMGILGGLFHLFNHATFKPMLFMNAGSVEHATGTRQLDELGGLWKKMPVTAVTSLIGAFSISGLPPFNGFWSKLFIILACVQAGRYWTAFAAVLGSILTLAYFMKALRAIFFGHPPIHNPAHHRHNHPGETIVHHVHEQVRESPWQMGLSVVLLSLVCLLAGIFSSLP